MSDSTEQALEQAFERVETGFPEEAVAILKPILEADPDDVDAWWIYAHAVADPNEARRALTNVQRLDPDYPGAADLVAKLDEKFPAPRIRRIDVAPPSTMPEAPASIPEPAGETPAPVRTYTASPSAEAAPPRRGSSLPLIAAVVAIAVIVIVLLLLSQGGGDTSPTPTSVVQVDASATPGMVAVGDLTDEVTEVAGRDGAGQATDVVEPTEPSGGDVTAEPTSEASDQATDEPDVTAEATAPVEVTAESTSEGGAEGVTGDFSALDDVLSRYTLPENGVETTETELGRTLLVNVCAAPGREMRTRAPEVLTLISRESPSFPTNLDGIGARMVNCETGATLLTLIVDRASADAFAEGSMPAREFEGHWQSV